MIFQSRFFLICLVLLTLASPAGARAEEPYRISLQAYRTDNVEAPVLAVLTLTPSPDWHAYGYIQGPSGFPTEIRATRDGQVISPLYPPPTPGPDPLDPSLIVELYDGPTPFFIPLPDGPATVVVGIKALLCSSTTCQPIKEELELVITTAKALPPAEEQDWWPRFVQAAPGPDSGLGLEPVTSGEVAQTPAARALSPRYFSPGLEVHTLSKAAALAFLAGLILNFMPCVLPVITLKLRSFIPAADSVPKSQRLAFRTHNLFFALGMMLYFLILAGIIAVTGMAWGQIFQEPAAIITLTAIVFALCLSLFGVYDLPLIDLKGKAKGVVHHPRLESFTTGILATILATPCSGPFLGGVLAWALIQPPDIIALVLSCIGLGMASPYLAMALFPGLYRFLPKPGAWTLHLERILGFLLAATCVYLFGLLPTSEYVNVLILLWTIALSAWIWGKWTSLSQSRTRRWSIRGIAVALVVLAAAFLFRPEGHPDPWKNFDMQQFETLRGQENLILDFTADWCPNCKFLEKTVLTPEKSAAFAKEHDAILMRVDLTRHDPELMALLESLGSKSIPILAIFPKGNPDSPLVLRDLFTGGQLKEALDQELP
ncbi:thiol:disulfide interchange protein DsbD [Desulfomicrobium macestii]|uniref:Thiol:disulfide interchange protein DsbD n=2 Tax=Desulfomicrobium TaxID=898 RepID=A0A8G2FFQ3_DESNO|nr:MULTISPECIES: cytochrome c biogenesis protein CcdA [Desulfomicrobium]MBE1424801.1 thiol:disulfide interchange protein DsbD [Desulfomicrobium macestii]SFM11098.1 thiol:disulfide interchange protein DsbD [Desulfomicrobium norvegicum]